MPDFARLTSSTETGKLWEIEKRLVLAAALTKDLLTKAGRNAFLQLSTKLNVESALDVELMGRSGSRMCPKQVQIAAKVTH